MARVPRETILVKATGEVIRTPLPKNQKQPDLAALQEAVGGYIEVVGCKFEDVRCEMIVNEEGRLRGLPRNDKATRYFQAATATFQPIVGDVLILKGFRLK